MRKTITLTQAIRILEQDRHDPCLCQLREGPDLDLHITINRGAAVSDPEPDQWEIVFEDYILYQVRNESFCSFHAEEIRAGKYLAVYERSRLLEYLPMAVDAGLLEHTQPWKHYGIFTQNQIIDVIAQADPVISCIEA